MIDRLGPTLLLTLLVALFTALAAGPNASAALPVTFTEPTKYSVGADHDPVAIAVADFNGDSDPDLAVANNNRNTVSILLGAAGGSFTGPTNFPTGSGPLSVAVGDFNGDSDPDLAFANGGGGVSILLGAADGSFTSPTAVFTGFGRPRSITVGDFNGDSDPDLAVANNPGGDVSILLGAADGSFTDPTNFPTGINPNSIAVGDFNGDSDPDLAMGDFNGGNVSILLGAADGSFTDPTHFSAGSFPTSVAVGDFNGDSDPDLAVANYGSGSGSGVSILLGAADGSFTGPTNFSADSHPVSVAVGDFNGDSDPDLAVANLNSSNVSILSGAAGGSFTGPTNFSVGNAGDSPYSIAVGDFNADSRDDLAVANIGSDDVSILLNTADAYVRPKGATPHKVSLVPAYASCTSPNRTHAAPLSHPSCNPPSQSSGYLTVGTTDANSQGARSTGYVRLAVSPGNPATPEDEAELGIDVQITDVRNKSDLSDYSGEVEVRIPARLTDKRNSPVPGPGGEGPGTTVDFTYPVVVGCSATADTTIGSTCELHTTFDAITPNAILESERSIWQLGQISVYDAGPDGLASTPSGNTLFETQGVFVP